MQIQKQSAIDLLCKLIETPSLSREEEKSAGIISDFFSQANISTERIGNNIIAKYTGTSAEEPYLLLCSHHDTVNPNASYTRDPFSADIQEGKLFGLGSNDAGGPLVALIGAFQHLVHSKSAYNLILAAVAEEEISGAGGVVSILEQLPSISLAIVGEPTQMEMAIAEKGLVVIDGIAQGVPGHAAHENTINPILQVCTDIQSIHAYQFDRLSPFLGRTKASVTVINAGELHNQVPAECHFVVDVRVNEMYGLEEVVEIIQSQVQSQLTPRSLRLKPSGIDPDHKMIRIAKDLKIPVFGSSTLSDQALLPFPSIKIGPGDSLRSHTADEFIYLKEIGEGIDKYVQLITAYFTTK